MKSILRIGISLLIALCFVIPTSAVLADRGDLDADIDANVPRPNQEKPRESEIRGIIPIEGSNHKPIWMAPESDVAGAFLAECDTYNLMPLTHNSIMPMLNCYDIWFNIQTTDGPNTIEPEIELYYVDALNEYCLYMTSFEDNAENYMNWQQIDKDCSDVGGYYDGWSWSDQRACGSEHSFKCSMYDEYKNMQDDWLFFEGTLEAGIDLTGGLYDLCDGTTREINPNYVKVDFDVYVDGEAAIQPDEGPNWCGGTVPLDYLLGGMVGPADEWIPITKGMIYDGRSVMKKVYNSDCTRIDSSIYGYNEVVIWDTNGPLRETGEGAPDWDWTLPEGCEPNCPAFPGIYAEKKDSCPGWWHVSYILDINSLPEGVAGHFKPAFRWISDKERAYEGAYVDNVEISVVEPQGEKIYQGHSQQWIQAENGSMYFKFPLSWTDEIKNTFDCSLGYDSNPDFYKAIIKIKNGTGGFDVYREIVFEIGNGQNLVMNSVHIEDDMTYEPTGGWPDNMIVPPGTDAHIVFEVCNSETRTGCDENGNPTDFTVGNLEPATDIEVTAKGYKIIKETLWQDDLEGMFGWQSWDDPEDGSYPFYQGSDSWSGSGCLAINNKANNLISGGDLNCDGNPDVWVDYIGYSNAGFSMEHVEEAVLDFYYKAVLPDGAQFYLCMIAYKYIMILEALFDYDQDGSTDTPLCQKTWVGPMQPQAMYYSVDIVSWFQLLYNRGYMSDENGHKTFDTAIGFYLDAGGVCKDELWPDCCFIEELPWSGVMLDDLSVTATKIGPLVWEDSMVIPGPVEAGQCCVDQFTWEDVPYSNYKIVVEVEGDCDMSFEQDLNVCNQKTSDNWEDARIRVLEICEAMNKVDEVDYTECMPEAWCISNVVGNDCGNDGHGDNYALATNCDSHIMPQGVQDTIGFTCLDVSHLWYTPPAGDDDDDDDDDNVEYCQPYDPDTSSAPFSSTYYPYRFYDNFDLGVAATLTNFEFYGIIAYGDDSPLGLQFNIGIFNDAANLPGTAISDQVWTCGASNFEYVEPFGSSGYSVWKIFGNFPTPISVPAGQIWFSPQSDDPMEDLACCWGLGGDGYSYHEPVGVRTDDLGFCVSNSIIGGTKDVTYDCQVVIDEGFEDSIWNTGAPAGWVNTGWLWDLAGNTPCEGSHYLAQFSAGTRLTTPPIEFGNSTDTPGHPGTLFTFQYYKESAAATQQLDIYLDYGTPEQVLVDTIINSANVQCTMYSYDFTGTTGMHTISIVLQTSGFYGTVIDDLVVSTCDEFVTEPEPEPFTPIWFNMTYQADLKGESAAYVEWSWSLPPVDCNGCDCEAPPGIAQWTTKQIPDTNKECSTFSTILSYCDGTTGLPVYYVPDGYVLNFRIRLDTDVVVAGRWVNQGIVWGIGLHIHEMGLSNVYNISLPENAPGQYKDAMWDFEDSAHSYTDIKVPLIDEKGWCDPGTHRELGEITLEQDCIVFGAHGRDATEFDTPLPGKAFEIADEYSKVVYAEGPYTLNCMDSYGDGWNTEWPVTDDPESHITLWVNDVIIVNQFGLDDASETFVFDADPGDIIRVRYDPTNQTSYTSENSWNVKGPKGNIVLSGSGSGIDDVTYTALPIDPENEFVVGYWPGEPIDEAIVWETEIADAYEAWLYCGEWMWHGDTPSAPLKGAIISFELSADDGDHWYVIAKKDSATVLDGYTHVDIPAGQEPVLDDLFDLTPWAGQSLLLRLRVQNIGRNIWDPNTHSISYRTYYRGYVAIRDVHIYCKHDVLPPTASISLSGNLVGPGMYAGAVSFTITAVDDMAMGQVHYKLDGVETTVNGNKATGKVSTDGAHTIEYWAVDASGNEGAHATVSFSIDSTPPTVSITGPEPGLYLFGKKLLSMSKPIIIGAFTAEATASDAQGLRVVRFMLNGEVIGEDTTAPFSAYVAVKNMGAATIKVVAVDGVGSTAEDTLDITYFKFL